MAHWEYRKINLNVAPRKSDDIDLLTDAGEDGCELIIITPNNIAYRKRLLEDPASARAPRRKVAASSVGGK